MRQILDWLWNERPSPDSEPRASKPSEPSETLRRRNLLRRFWRTAIQFWSSGERHTAWILSGGLLLVIVLLLGAAYAMNVWNRAMFDSLQVRDTDAVARLSLIYFAILGISVLLSAGQCA